MKAVSCSSVLAFVAGCSLFGRGERTSSGAATESGKGTSAPAGLEGGPVANVNSSSPSADVLQQNLIMPDFSRGVDGVELGFGRNDNVTRLYGPVTYEGSGYEWSYENGSWVDRKIYSGIGTHCTPRLGDLNGRGNTLYMGIWGDVGVSTLAYRDTWSSGSIVAGSSGKGRILSVKPADARNDGIQRLYIGSDKGLFEYSWHDAGYAELVVLAHAVGDFGLGDGRNDGVRRIYAGERGGSELHELTWDGNAFRDEVVFRCSQSSEYASHVGDGRGDGMYRVYAWCGKLFELTYERGKWTQVTVDEASAARFYIRSGRVRSDGRSRLYVSQKSKGLVEYTWSGSAQRFQDVDVVSGATGGCAIGDGRGDGKNRLYVARGSGSAYSAAAVVELSSANPPPARL